MSSVCVIVKVSLHINDAITPILCVIGVLCGECRGRKGVSTLLNKCVDCEDVNSLLIVTLSEGITS